MSFNIWYGGDQVDFNRIIEAIKKADADIVGLQEPDGKTLEIAALAGYPYADVRRHIISKFPLFDSGEARRAAVVPPTARQTRRHDWPVDERRASRHQW